MTLYRQIVEDALQSLANQQYAERGITNEVVFDRNHDRYLVMVTGWEGTERRIHYCLVHIDIIDGKIWIQRDGTEYGIGYTLESAGIMKEDLVPAFHPRNIRPYTGYAVA